MALTIDEQKARAEKIKRWRRITGQACNACGLVECTCTIEFGA